MEDLNLKRGIRAILSEIGQDCFEINRSGIDLVNRLMLDVCKKLVDYCEKNSSGDTMDVTTAESAVTSIFPDALKNLAFAQAGRTLLLYSTEMIIYEPKLRKKKTRKAFVMTALEFTDGVCDLTALCFPEGSLQDHATKLLCEFLEELALKIAYFVQLNEKGSITLADISAVIENLFPGQLSRHAIAEGARMILLYEAGMLQVTRKKVETVSERKRSPRKTTEKAPRKRSVRKRKGSPSVGAPRKKRRRKDICKRPATRKKRRRKARSKRPAKRKKAVCKAPKRKRTPRKTSAKAKRRKKSAKGKEVCRTKTIRKRPKTRKKIARKPRRAPRKVGREKTVTPRAPSRGRKVDGKKKERRGGRSRDAATVKEIRQGIVNLNKSYHQSLSTDSLTMIVECLDKLFVSLIAEMIKSKCSVIGPQEVRTVVKKVFPTKLAEMAIAQISRALMDIC